MRISWTSYTFNKPRPPSEREYQSLKSQLSHNPQYNLAPTSSFLLTFEYELMFLGAGVAGALVATIAEKMPKSPIRTGLELVGVLAAMFGFFSLFSFIPSFVSYLGFLASKSSYYSRLRKDILSSSSYAEFISLERYR